MQPAVIHVLYRKLFGCFCLWNRRDGNVLRAVCTVRWCWARNSAGQRSVGHERSRVETFVCYSRLLVARTTRSTSAQLCRLMTDQPSRIINTNPVVAGWVDKIIRSRIEYLIPTENVVCFFDRLKNDLSVIWQWLIFGPPCMSVNQSVIF